MFVLAAENSGGAAGGVVGGIVGIVVAIVMIASLWKLFSKAGQPGWTAIIPILNIFVLAKVAKRPLWWGLLALFCCIFLWVLYFDVAKQFGKKPGYAIGMIILPVIFFPILAFGEAQYQSEPDPIF